MRARQATAGKHSSVRRIWNWDNKPKPALGSRPGGMLLENSIPRAGKTNCRNLDAGQQHQHQENARSCSLPGTMFSHIASAL
jgi:hypothetical protein